MQYLKFQISSTVDKREAIIEELEKNDQFIYEEYGSQVIDELDQNEKNWDFVDSEILNMDKTLIKICLYFALEDRNKAQDLKDKFDDKDLGKVEIITEDDQDWSNNWKKYYHPIEISKKLVIKPYWEDYDNKDDRKIVEIDPGMAFGTGSHETTYLCLESIEKYVKEKDKIFDIGCGSGILAIASVKLGAESAICVDIDENCIKASKHNAKINGVEDKLTIYKGNLLDVIEGNADIIVSNIIAEVIVEMVPDLRKHLNENGIIIFSGIITEKVKMVTDKLSENNFEIVEIKDKNGWNLIIGRIKNV